MLVLQMVLSIVFLAVVAIGPGVLVYLHLLDCGRSPRTSMLITLVWPGFLALCAAHILFFIVPRAIYLAIWKNERSNESDRWKK